MPRTFALICLTLLSIVSPARGAEITVSAAVSLQEALTRIGATYAKSAGDRVNFNFGASGQLLAQIREGAPVDAYIAAADKQMDDAEAEKLILPKTRRIIAGNALVLIVPAATDAKLKSFDQVADPSIKRLSIGQPKTVPAGEYAMDVLDHLKLTEKLADRIVHGASVRQVLDYVERGEVDAGIVYRTDAMQSGNKVRVAATAETSWHRPIRYPAAIVTSSKHHDAAAKFLDYLATDIARSTLAARGFAPPPPAPTSSTAPATSPAKP